MNRKTILILSSTVILALIVVLAYVVVTRTPTTRVYVYPQSTVTALGQNFTVNVTISDVSDLYGWRLKLSWNNTLLDVLNVTEGAFLQNGSQTFFSPPIINGTAGYLVADCTLLGNTKGVSGSGVLATIQFHVEENGDCSLHLYDLTLLSSAVQSIVSNVNDGHFSTT